MLPISINSGEPRWFHDFKDRNYMFKDKRGIWNGGYIDEISSSNLNLDKETCHDCNRIKYVGENCPFLNTYFEKLNKLDFEKTIQKLEKVTEHFNCKDICFVVFEKDDVVCGERQGIKKWFNEHGVEIKEFKKSV